MPETLEIQAFAYTELSPEAQERARGWWITSYEPDFDWLLFDIEEAATMLGIEIEKRGNRRSIYWRAAHCQSDGASFSGNYYYRKGALAAIMKERPTDTALHTIARNLQEAQRKTFYGLSARIESRRDTSVSVSVTNDRDRYGDSTREQEEDIAESMHDFAYWIYRRALDTWDAETSEEAIADCMAANEYRFDERGRIIY
jgi:hypothetical protein